MSDDLGPADETWAFKAPDHPAGYAFTVSRWGTTMWVTECTCGTQYGWSPGLHPDLEHDLLNEHGEPIPEAVRLSLAQRALDHWADEGCPLVADPLAVGAVLRVRAGAPSSAWLRGLNVDVVRFGPRAEHDPTIVAWCSVAGTGATAWPIALEDLEPSS